MKYLALFILVVASHLACGQELFPANEPASNIPKGTVGVRFLYETYKELPSQRTRFWNALRLMYGVTGKLTVMATGSVSNHHIRRYPSNVINYFINHHQKSFPANPTMIEGVNLYAKYRWLTIDEKQKHIRVAAYGELGKSFVPHDEAEPMLGGDNSGLGGGMIGTLLYKRFAISMLCGFVNPFPYKDKEQDIEFRSGNSWHYNISAGYRVFPKRYSSYDNINVNIYAEVINKHHQAAEMKVQGQPFDFDLFQFYDPVIYNSTQENKYSELRTSIQFIFQSNNRIDIGIAHPLYRQSFNHFYPLYFFSLQKYFFPKKGTKIRL